MSWVNDPDVRFYFANGDKVFSEEKEREYLSQLIHSKNDIVYSIFEGEEYVGQIGLHQICWKANKGRLSINLKRSAWGRGIASEASQKFLERVFICANLNKIFLIVHADNIKGLRLWHKVGFRTEGILREEYFSAGQYHDIFRMSILKSDWSKNA